jgi:hypothetical protein
MLVPFTVMSYYYPPPSPAQLPSWSSTACHAGQNHSLIVANKFFEMMAKFKCLVVTRVTKIVFTKKLRVDFIRGVQNILPSHVISKT